MRRDAVALSIVLFALMIWNAPDVAARRGRSARSPAGKSDPRDMLLVVQQQPPKPPKKGAKPVVPRYGSFSRYSASRRSQTLYLRSTPGGSTVTALPVGVKVRVIKRGRTHSKVETGGLIRVTGYVPNVVLGLRVQDRAKLFGRVGGKAVGEVSRSQLVHLEKVRGVWARVQIMGYVPLRCWIKRKALGLSPTGYGGKVTRRYPGRNQMTMAPGKIRTRPNGPVAAVAMDEGRVFRISVKGRWSQVAMYDYSRLSLRGWVLTERLSWRASPWFGTGYRRSNCSAGTSGNRVALSSFKLYAQMDDAWPTIRVMPRARFNVYRQANGWVRITSRGCLSFSGYAEDRAGDWLSASLVRR